MTAERRQGFHDPVANTRVSRLQSEVQLLAHSSPPVVGRDAKIRELKAAASILRDYQLGFTSFTWFLSIWRHLAVVSAVAGIAVLLVRNALYPELPTMREAVVTAGTLLVSIVAVGAWDFLTTRRRLRMAEALADSLVDAPIGSSAKAQ